MVNSFCFLKKKMASRLFQFSRNFSSTNGLRASLSEPVKTTAAADKHGESWKMWKNLFVFACIPAMFVSWLNVYLAEEPKKTEFKKYEHLRIRRKKYPWKDGVKTLFHNPHFNALPDGYEDVEGHH